MLFEYKFNRGVLIKDISNFAPIVAEAMFNNEKSVEVEGNTYNINVFPKSGLKYVDIDEFRFVEQNPNKNSNWAKMARAGKKIVWIFKHQSYYARVIDGKFTKLAKK